MSSAVWTALTALYEQHSSQHHGWPVRSSPVHGSEKALGASSAAFQLQDTRTEPPGVT